MWLLDLSNLASVKAFAERFSRESERLDIAVMNAAIAPPLEPTLTNDGWETASVVHRHFRCTVTETHYHPHISINPQIRNQLPIPIPPLHPPHPKNARNSPKIQHWYPPPSRGGD